MRILILVLVVVTCVNKRCSPYSATKQSYSGNIQPTEQSYSGIIQQNGYSYEISSEKATWDAAKTSCENLAENSSLAVLNTGDLLNSVRRALRRKHFWGIFWVGLRRYGSNYTWVNNETLNSDLRFYAQWKSLKKCYAIRGNMQNFTKRKCDNEDHMFRFICEVPTANSAKGLNYSIVLRRNGYTYKVSSKETTWYTARRSCERLTENSSLAVLNTPELLTSVSAALFRNDPGIFWVGLRFRGKLDSGNFSWVNNETLNTSLQAERALPQQRCYAINSSSSYNFTKSKCNNWRGHGHKFRFICEVPTTNSVAQSTSSTIASSSASLENSETSSMQPTSYMRTTSEINPTKTSSVQPSTTTIPTTSAFKNTQKTKDFREFMKTLNTSNPDSMLDLLTNYSGLTKWIDEGDQSDVEEYNPLTDAKDIEDIALEFTKQHLSSKKKNMSIINKDIAFHAMHVDADLNSDVIFPETSDPDVNTISLPKSLFKGQETFVVNVVYKNNKNIRQLTPTATEGRPDDKKTWSVNTGIFSLTIFPKRKQLPENVNITLHHIQKMTHAKPHCCFWNFSIPTNYSGSWSQQGCHEVSTKDTHTVCACNHLTNFAVLMKLNDHEVSSIHKEALLVITYVGLTLSLLGEAITVLLYYFFLNLRHEKIQIRVNLLCALAAAQIVFLAGIDKTENKDLCTFVASLLHLFYLVSFCWMLMEGVYLYRMVVQVFDAHITMRYSYIFAFGFPLCIVVIALISASAQSEGIYSYVSSYYCWIRFENGFIWSFVVPVLILIVINSFFLFRVLKEMASMKSVQNVNSLELSSIKASAHACVVLLPLLGITWLFGLLSAVTTHVAWQYVFTILNALQGFMIFVFHCLRNTELKAAMELRYFQWESRHVGVGHRSSTPSKFLTVDESDKSRSNSLPMTTKVNQVIPEKQTSKA